MGDGIQAPLSGVTRASTSGLIARLSMDAGTSGMGAGVLSAVDVAARARAATRVSVLSSTGGTQTGSLLDLTRPSQSQRDVLLPLAERQGFDPAAARAKRRDAWIEWVALMAAAAARARSRLPNSEDRRALFRELLMGFQQVRAAAAERASVFTLDATELRQRAQGELVQAKANRRKRSDRQAFLETRFIVRRFENKLAQRQYGQIEDRKAMTQKLQSRAMTAIIAARKEVSTSTLEQRDRRTEDSQRASQPDDDAAMAPKDDDAAMAPKMVGTASVLRPRDVQFFTPEAIEAASLEEESGEVRERLPALADDGGLKALLAQHAGVVKQMPEPILTDRVAEPTDGETDAAMALVDLPEPAADLESLAASSNDDAPRRAARERRRRPSPVYVPVAVHWADSAEVDSPAAVDPRLLRAEPMRLTKLEFSRKVGAYTASGAQRNDGIVTADWLV